MTRFTARRTKCVHGILFRVWLFRNTVRGVNYNEALWWDFAQAFQMLCNEIGSSCAIPSQSHGSGNLFGKRVSIVAYAHVKKCILLHWRHTFFMHILAFSSSSYLCDIPKCGGWKHSYCFLKPNTCHSITSLCDWKYNFWPAARSIVLVWNGLQ